MKNLHAHIMSIVKAHQEEDNNVQQNEHPSAQSKPNNVSSEVFRLSCNYTTPMTAALFAQLMRYCEAHMTAPIHKRNDPDVELSPMAKSKVVRHAVYEAMRTPAKVSNAAKPFPASKITLPPERVCIVSWTMPQSKPQDADYLRLLYPTYGGDQSTFVRRAIFVFTNDYRSTDKHEDALAARDAWC